MKKKGFTLIKKVLLTIFLGILFHNISLAEISRPTQSNLITKIASWGGVAIFGDFGLVTAGSNSENTISFEAANCNKDCTDSAYAQSVERYTVTVTGVVGSKSD